MQRGAPCHPAWSSLAQIGLPHSLAAGVLSRLGRVAFTGPLPCNRCWMRMSILESFPGSGTSAPIIRAIDANALPSALFADGLVFGIFPTQNGLLNVELA